MNGENRKHFLLVLVSLGVGALIASMFGNADNRDRLVRAGKKLLSQ